MFDSLSDRLGSTLQKLRGQGRLTENNIKDSLREVRMALLEADVALPVVKAFIEKIKEMIYINFQKGLFCTIPCLLHKFLLDKGVNHIVEYQAPFFESFNYNQEKRHAIWEQLLEAYYEDMKEAWNYFLRK